MDLPLNDELYLQFRELLRSRAGLHYPDRKRNDLAYGLNQALRASGCAGFSELYRALPDSPALWRLLMETLTIGETYFFRNSAQFVVLRERILPELIGRRSETRYVRLWSAGCATGEEPYSLAMILHEMLGSDARWQPSLLATDINQAFLERAREGLYSEWSFRETTAEQRAHYFEREGTRWRLQEYIRRMVMFQPLNLVTDEYPSLINGTSALDVLFCRNVMIYFDEPTIIQVVDRLFRTLAPGGWLFVGHAEPQTRIYNRFEVHNFPDTVVYRKPLDAPMFAERPASVTAQPPLRRVPSTRPLPETRVRQREAVQPARNAAPLIPPPAAESAKPAAVPLAPGEQSRLLSTARNHADRGQWEEARRICEQVLASDSLASMAHYLLAQIDEHEGHFAAALAGYRRAGYLDRTFAAATLGMANVLRQTGHYSDAGRSYRRVLKQLSGFDPHAIIIGTDGVRAKELSAYVRRQLAILDPAGDADS